MSKNMCSRGWLAIMGSCTVLAGCAVPTNEQSILDVCSGFGMIETQADVDQAILLTEEFRDDDVPASGALNLWLVTFCTDDLSVSDRSQCLLCGELLVEQAYGIDAQSTDAP